MEPIKAEAGLPVQTGKVSITMQLEHRKAELEHELAAVNRALEGLRAHPETQAVLDAVSEVMDSY